MKDSGLATSVLRSLVEGLPRTTSEIGTQLREAADFKHVSDSQVFDFLLRAEAEGMVNRIRTDAFDELRPVSTISWQIVPGAKLELRTAEESQEKEAEYVSEAKIVVSQPIFLSSQGINLGGIGAPVLDVREAMERIVIDAKDELRIACPYYDELFLEVLSKSAERVARLRRLLVLSESMDPILIRATHLFPSMRVKTVQRILQINNSNYKVQGVHAKIIIADRSEVLLGSFNFRFSHILYNVDLGLLANGRIVEDFVKIFDSIWGR